MEPLADLKIRRLDKGDLEAIIEIDAKVLGESRRDYWRAKLSGLDEKSSHASLVAESKGRVIGFILGDISGWEFGVPDTMGWIDTVGIDPEYQKQGVARALAGEVIRNLRTVGVTKIYTLVSWDDWDLLQFFHAIGFSRGDMINLELRI